MKILRRTQFGNPILRSVSKQVTKKEITSKTFKELIKNMRYTLAHKNYGVGLAAPQIGELVALAIIGSKPTPTRPKAPTLDMTLINPRIIRKYGKPEPMWEGCISGPDMYGKTDRYKKVRLEWIDHKGIKHTETFEGLLAQIIQHEVDHLRGVLFVDRVSDTKSYMTFSEYRKKSKADAKKIEKPKTKII